VIAVGRDAESLQAYFEKVVAAGAAESDWALESRITVLLCRGLERPIEDVWPEVKIFV
jgi:hypothetical protein